MTTPKAKLAGLALIAAFCAGFTLGLTAPAWAGFDEGLAAYQRGDYGQGVPRDYVQAHMWFNLAASKSPPGEDRDKAAKNRDNVAKVMTPAQISEAQKLAREWKAK